MTPLSIFWNIPTALQSQYQYDKIKIYRSATENTGYNVIDIIASQDPTGVWKTSYNDLAPSQKYYIVSLYNSVTTTESSYLLALTDFTIRERRLVDIIKTSMPPLINRHMTDFSFRSGLQIGVQMFNAVPPFTDFTINDFPYEIEGLLIIAGQMGAILTNYLPVSFRNIDYSLTGFTLRTNWSDTLDRALTQWQDIFRKTAEPIKMEFGPSPLGMGTFMLPLSLGARIAPGLLDVFNILNVG